MFRPKTSLGSLFPVGGRSHGPGVVGLVSAGPGLTQPFIPRKGNGVDEMGTTGFSVA